jgi:lambda repressor-like predicted transcriptional regulator
MIWTLTLDVYVCKRLLRMHPSDRKSALKKRGYTATAVAADLGVDQSAVSNVLAGRTRSARIEAMLSELIGLTPQKIWPEWYGGIKSDESSHPAVDASLMGEVRARCLVYGLRYGCDQPYAIPKLRHVVGVYNFLRGKLTGSESVEQFNAALDSAVESYASPFHDRDEPDLFKRGWWEPLSHFVL